MDAVIAESGRRSHVCGRVIDEYGLNGIDSVTAGLNTKNTGIGLDELFLPGNDDAIEPGKKIKPRRWQGERLVRPVGQCVKRHLVPPKFIENVDGAADRARDHFVKVTEPCLYIKTLIRMPCDRVGIGLRDRPPPALVW